VFLFANGGNSNWRGEMTAKECERNTEENEERKKGDG
jgi:hypothetical protein